MATAHLKCPQCGARLLGGRSLICVGCGLPLVAAKRCGEITVRRLSALHERVAADLCEGQAMENIERWIDQTPGLDDEHRAALWLYAWEGAERR